MRRRFFVDRFDANRALVRGETAEHLGRVLRAKPGQLYELSDGREVWLGKTETVGKSEIEFSLVERIASYEPALTVVLWLAIVKFDRFEWAIEKATELGANTIVPLAAARSESALVAAAEKRAARWEKILRESAQQARRLRPPELRAVTRPAEAFAGDRSAVRILLSEREDTSALRDVLGNARSKSAASAAVAVGPEGGWTDAEFDAARAAGLREASLGENILRTETAVCAALASIRFALG
ncbi:MAG: RsmE family RNA methyltransferase [Candidatus Acidiferrales bacterium]